MYCSLGFTLSPFLGHPTFTAYKKKKGYQRKAKRLQVVAMDLIKEIRKSCVPWMMLTGYT